MESDYAWQIEKVLLGIYDLLVHRLKGSGLTLNNFWESDTWTISYLYLMELDLIDKENEETNGGKSDPSHMNNPEVDDLMVEMGLDDD